MRFEKLPNTTEQNRVIGLPTEMHHNKMKAEYVHIYYISIHRIMQV